MMKLGLTFSLFLSYTCTIFSQDVQSVMTKVASNNPEIIACRKLLEARTIEAKTGITPPDPVVSVGYMPGHGSTSGTKRTFSLNQSFSFPTKYLAKVNLGKSNIVLAEQEFRLVFLDRMNEARLMLFDLIYYEKMLETLKNRRLNYDRLKLTCQAMVEKGETTILDFNKINIELSSLKTKILSCEAEITMLKERLSYMTGDTISFNKSIGYPLFTDKGPDTLLREKEAIHPAFLLPEAEYKVMQQEARLSRTGSLPEFQAGYSSEIIPGENYGGPVAGMSVPLWSNANRVKASRAMVEQSAAARDAELLRLKSQVRSDYKKMLSLKESILLLKQMTEDGKNLLMLEKALSSGEISFYTYFQYLGSEYEVTDRLAELENEYYKTLGRLFDHELLR